MKVLIETGKERQTTSHAYVQAILVDGQYNGKLLYEPPGYQKRANWDPRNDIHSEWIVGEYDLPAGTEFVIRARGFTGSNGSIRHEFHRIYRVSETAPVVDMLINVGLREALLKGRLELVRDVLAEQAAAQRIETETGF